MNALSALNAVSKTANGVTPELNSKLKAGAAETIVTRVKDDPAQRVLRLIDKAPGDLEDVHDELYARALVLNNGEQRVAIVTVDIGSLDGPAVLSAIEEATGIPKTNIAVNWSHTHGAPGVDGRAPAPGSGEWLADALSQLVQRAIDNLQEATLRVGREPAQIGYNRRLMGDDGYIRMEVNPEGAIVPWTDVLGIYGINGTRIAVMFSHAAHPVIVHWASEAITADFPGYAVGHLRNLLDKHSDPQGVLMFAQGCCANINGYPLRGGYDAADSAGLSLAFAAKNALTKAVTVSTKSLRAYALKVSLPYWHPPIESCKTMLEHDPNSRHRERLLRIIDGGSQEFLSYPMSGFAIGDELCMVFLPSETFAEYQLFADEISPFKYTVVFGYTNRSVGYVATKNDYDLDERGGYEASINHRWPLEPSIEAQIREGITQLFCKLK
ncbi:MAG: hypothetical protein OXN17_13840 [Candidatus Poribacteria bacterium]|nr:hypothetical protein [Candidatus Poribacteria bacterium]MDE0506997.1 hypothetical protein [Candidatus Poribacteria bacterium]